MERRIINSILMIVSACIFIVLLDGCYYDNEQDLYPPIGNCDTTNITYSGKVAPIITNRCYSCHSNAQAPSSGNNISLEGHANLSGYITINQVTFLDAIQHTGTASPMPQSGAALSTCEVKKIKIWIQAGMPNN